VILNQIPFFLTFASYRVKWLCFAIVFNGYTYVERKRGILSLQCRFFSEESVICKSMCIIVVVA